MKASKKLGAIQVSGECKIAIEHFADAFSKIHGIPPGYSPFTVDDYLESFDPDNLLSLLKHED